MLLVLLFIPKRLIVKIRSLIYLTEVPELYDVEGPKSMAPPIELKPLGRIGSNFLWKPLRRILSGASRGFLNFVVEAEILGHLCSFQSLLEGPKTL